MTSQNRGSLHAERSANLGQWAQDMEDEVVYLGELLEMSSPAELLDDLRSAIPDLDELYEYEDVESLGDEDFAKVSSVLLAFVGVYLIKKFNGRWDVESDPDSSSHARYLVCLPDPHGVSEVRIDVGGNVNKFLHEPIGRSFLQFLIRLEGLVAP